MSRLPMTPVGYFMSPDQEEPEYDPGYDVPCPVCSEPIRTRDRVTISLMERLGTLSLFFRAHRDCWEGTSEEVQGEIEARILRSINAEEGR